MATKQSTVDFILEQIAQAGDVSAKKMFGEYGVYCEGKMVALVCDDQLFIKITAAGEKFIGSHVEGRPYPGAKPCFLVSGDKWDNREWLSQLVKVTAESLPNSKKKTSRKTA